MKTFKCKYWTVYAEILRYPFTDNLAIDLLDVKDDDLVCSLTVNLMPLPENHALVDTNNCPWAPEFIQKYGLGTPTGDFIRSGYVQYPVYEFNLASLA